VAWASLQLWWSDFYFDSDEAVAGLMAADIAAGRAFPLTIYGQQYLLPVPSWLAAPLFVLLSPSIFLLKLPLAIINVATVVLLIRALVRDAGLTWPAAFASTVFLALPAVLASSRLLENPEPLLWAVLLWMARRRPLTAGLMAAVGYVNREFVAYAVAALLLVDLVFRMDPWPRWCRRWAIFGVTMMAAVELLRFLMRLAPRTFGPSSWGVGLLSAQTVAENARFLMTDMLPALFGFSAFPLRLLSISSRLLATVSWAAWPLGLSSLLLIPVALWRMGQTLRRRPQPSALPFYLILTGATSVIAFALFVRIPVGLPLVRYLLLALFVPVGFTSLLLIPGHPVWQKWIAVLAVVVWLAVQGVAHGRLWYEFLSDCPPDSHQVLADYLESHHLTRGDGVFWAAYNVTFRTNGRVMIRAPEYTRIQWPPYWYSGDAQFSVDYEPRCADAVQVDEWWVCVLPRITRTVGADGFITITEETAAATRYDARPLLAFVPESDRQRLAPAFDGEPGTWLRGTPGARVLWHFQGGRTTLLEVLVRRPNPSVTFRLPGPATARVVDLDIATVLSTHEFNGEPNAAWSIPLPPLAHRLGVVVALSEPR
jgi:hypothetical protein